MLEILKVNVSTYFIFILPKIKELIGIWQKNDILVNPKLIFRQIQIHRQILNLIFKDCKVLL